MMIKREEREDIEGQQFNDRMDVLRHVSDIKLRLKEDITNDFILAKLGDKDKEFIIEMTGNAYFAKKLVDLIASRGKAWDWKNNTFVERFLDKDEKERIKKIGKAIFDSYMIKIYMIVVLNRNVEKNYLINVLSGYLEREEPQMEIGQNENKAKSLIKDILADNQKKEEK